MRIGFWKATDFHQPSFLLQLRITSSETLTLETMGSEVPAKRPFCPSCSKPARVCLCSRIKTPLLDNSIAVTILQHNQEKKHPLNSTRIATLGFKNLTVATVSDVHFEAQFHIRLLKSMNWKCVSSSGNSNPPPKPVFEIQNRTSIEQNVVDCPNFDQIEATPIGEEEGLITATVAKCGVTCSLTQLSTPENHLKNPNFDQLLDSQLGKDAVSNGFSVKKFQRKQKSDEITMDFEELEEYEIVIPPGSALLFPTKNSISLESVDFEVKHLIVLDGTWRKAKRMYHENPWLKVLPHLKLDLNKASLYSEVRHQPRAGCLSSIESILFAMKALGDDQEGLNNLMDVFESMVGDQGRCKDENVSKISTTA